MNARTNAARPTTIEPIERRIMMAAHHPLAITDAPAVTSDVTTFHNDTARTGADLAETTLTPADVKAGTFGLLRSLPVDGQVYAQPLYLKGLTVAGATHNVVFVATENDDVYAFDSDTGAQLWYRTFLSAGVTPATSDDVGVTDIDPLIGITGTPVIDPATNVMYLVTKEKTTAADGTATFTQHVRSISVATGLDGRGRVGGDRGDAERGRGGVLGAGRVDRAVRPADAKPAAGPAADRRGRVRRVLEPRRQRPVPRVAVRGSTRPRWRPTPSSTCPPTASARRSG